MALPFSSLFNSFKTAAFCLLLAFLVPFLFPILCLCFSFLLVLFFPFAFAVLFLALLLKFSSALLSFLPQFLPLSNSSSARSLAWHSPDHAAACTDRPGAEPSLEPAESKSVHDRRWKTLPEQPDSAFEASDGLAFPRTARSASQDKRSTLDRCESAEEIPLSGPSPAAEVETATDFTPTISSFVPEASGGQQIEKGSSQDEEEDVHFQDSSEQLTPCEQEPCVALAPVNSVSQETKGTNKGEAPAAEVETATDFTPTISSIVPEASERQQIEKGSSQDEEGDVQFLDSSEQLTPCEQEPWVALAPVNSVLQETKGTNKVEDVSNLADLQGTDQHAHVSSNEDILSPKKEMLPELLADNAPGECGMKHFEPYREDNSTTYRVSNTEDSLSSRREESPELVTKNASGVCETKSVQPFWEDKSTSDREAEEMLETEELRSGNERTLELQGLRREDLPKASEPLEVKREELPKLSAEQISDECETTNVQPSWINESPNYGRVEGKPDTEVLHHANEGDSEFPGLKRDELPEFSAENVFGECETTSVHPCWIDENTSHRGVERNPGMEVLHSDNEQYEIPEQSEDVARPEDVVRMDRIEGFTPTAGKDRASPEPGERVASDCFRANEIAGPACMQDATQSCEDEAFKHLTARDDFYRGAEVGAAESAIESSEVETSPVTCASSPRSGIENSGEKDKENDSEADTCSLGTSVTKSIEEPTGQQPNTVGSSKETNMMADIDAIKKIVGYQGDLHGCLIEQIQALYVFVGMEPCSSIVNRDDIEMAREEVEVLKTVIGIE